MRPTFRGALATACALLALGCGAPTPAVSFSVTRFLHEPPERIGDAVVAAGVDLDGRHDMVEGAGCAGALDFVSADGEPGIDNQYAAALIGWLDAALGDTTSAVNAPGTTGWVIDVTGIDDLHDSVLVEVWEQEGATPVRQTLLARAMGTVNGEWLDVDLGTLALPMGPELGYAMVDHVRLHVRIFPGGDMVDATTGELGGSVSMAEVLSVSRAFEPGLDLPSAERMAMPDLDWDGDGACEAASLGVGLELTRL